MGRPAAFDRDAAIETAMQEIWRTGYEATSVKAMSEKLGITRSSYYNAFGSREDLFKEALGAYFAQSPDRVLYGALPAIPIRMFLTSTFRSICAARASDPEGRGCLAINCLCELKGGPHDDMGTIIANAVLKSLARLEELLQIAIANGELPKDAPIHAIALSLQTLMVGLNALSKAVRSEDELWQTAKVTLEGLGIFQEAPVS